MTDTDISSRIEDLIDETVAVLQECQREGMPQGHRMAQMLHTVLVRLASGIDVATLSILFRHSGKHGDSDRWNERAEQRIASARAILEQNEESRKG